MLKWLRIAAVLLLTLPQLQCRPASAERVDAAVDVAIIQSGDSIGVVLDWSVPPQADDQFPVARYLVRVIHDQEGDTLAAGVTIHPATIDTLWIPQPSLGDTLVFYGAVLTVDNRGNEAATWLLSNPFTWMSHWRLPSPPSGITIDTTTGALVIDSVQIIHFAAIPRDDDGNWLLTVGQWYKQGAVFYSGGFVVDCCCPALSAAMWQGDPSVTGHPCDEVEIIDLGAYFRLPPEIDGIKYVTASTFCGAGTDIPREGVVRIHRLGS